MPDFQLGARYATSSPARSHKELRLAVISHPNTVTSNQAVYLKLGEMGWNVTCIIPARWKDDYRPEGFRPRALPGLEHRVRFLPVANAGSPQRHFYLANPGRQIRALVPQIAFLEQEPFSVPAIQWSPWLRRAGVPIVLQADENLDRPFPWPALLIRRWLLPRVNGIAARSPAAADLQRSWGATGLIRVVPHTTAPWTVAAREGDPVFTIGFAGRLVPQKGLGDLLEAASRLTGPIRLLVVGDGPMRDTVSGFHLPNGRVELRTGVRPERMGAEYADMDVLVLPSSTTRTWAEQFGRVLVEAMLSGRPVVGSDSGEIPWVIETTGGGRVFPEGDVGRLAEILNELKDSPAERARLGAQGARTSHELFGVEACARALDGLLRDVLSANAGGLSTRP